MGSQMYEEESLRHLRSGDSKVAKMQERVKILVSTPIKILA